MVAIRININTSILFSEATLKDAVSNAIKEWTKNGKTHTLHQLDADHVLVVKVGVNNQVTQ